jgi:hypothetical protein
MSPPSVDGAGAEGAANSTGAFCQSGDDDGDGSAAPSSSLIKVEAGAYSAPDGFAASNIPPPKSNGVAEADDAYASSVDIKTDVACVKMSRSQTLAVKTTPGLFD